MTAHNWSCQHFDPDEAASWLEHPETLIGIDAMFLREGAVATLVPSPHLSPAARRTAESFVRSLGRLPLWVEDNPGLILPRIVCMLVNEAAFAVMEGVADQETIDLAMRLGVNYPHGPLAWGETLGYDRVLAVLDHLYNEYHEARYRACALLRRWARAREIDRKAS